MDASLLLRSNISKTEQLKDLLLPQNIFFDQSLNGPPDTLAIGRPIQKLWAQICSWVPELLHLWQYRFWSFQRRNTKLERFLAKNQL